MISRKTIFSLLLALLVAAGLRAWVVEHPDNCSRYAAGDPSATPTEYVETGTRRVEMPCNLWFPRQPVWVQVITFFDCVVAVVFVLSVWGDLARWKARRLALR